jgi:hypothetical protein
MTGFGGGNGNKRVRVFAETRNSVVPVPVRRVNGCLIHLGSSGKAVEYTTATCLCNPPATVHPLAASQPPVSRRPCMIWCTILSASCSLRICRMQRAHLRRSASGSR